MEIWKDIIGYEDYYQISNYGNIKAKERIVLYSNGIKTRYPSKIRKPSLSEYRMIALSKNGVTKVFKISRLVALHFIEIDKSRNVVNHKDFNKHNDNVLNLEWVTNSENVLHSNNRNKKEIKGIFFDIKRNKWCCYLYRNNKNIFIGRFITKEEAILQQKIKLNDFTQDKY
jgi:hypothetical protein